MSRRDDFNNVVGRNIKKYRGIAGFSQEELAFRAECEQSAISNYERGVNVPTAERLAKIATELNISVEQLDPTFSLEGMSSRDQKQKILEERLHLLDEHQLDILLGSTDQFIALNQLVYKDR